MKATCCLWLHRYGHNKIERDTYPVKLRVTFNRKVKYYFLGMKLSESQFARLSTHNNLKAQHRELNHYLEKAESIASELQDGFQWALFEHLFYKEREDKPEVRDVFHCFQEYASQLFKEGRIHSHNGYRSALNHLKGFHPKKELHFFQITTEWLKEFHAYMASKGMQNGSLGVYMRYLRTIFNQEIAAGRVKQESYPFGRNKYRPPATRRVKKALRLDDVEKIYEYTPSNERERWARDMWMFSYMANGMNMKDVALLKYENIVGDEIHFVRSKTSQSTIDRQKVIQICLQDELREIISRWGKTIPRPSSYIFDIIKENDSSPLRKHKDIAQAIQNINNIMFKISKELNLEKRPTCNFARHTYSTVLKRANVPIEMISENLGHTSIQTTEIYLDSFEKENRVQVARLLLPKKKIPDQPTSVNKSDKPGESKSAGYGYGD